MSGEMLVMLSLPIFCWKRYVTASIAGRSPNLKSSAARSSPSPHSCLRKSCIANRAKHAFLNSALSPPKVRISCFIVAGLWDKL